MQSESARMSSALEASYRIDRPNSRPRAVKVVALDHRADQIVTALQDREWRGAAFFRAADLVMLPALLADQVRTADMVVMIAAAGDCNQRAAVIGRACSDQRVTTIGLILTSPDTPDEALSQSLAALRPWMLMLVVSPSSDYIEDMLHALRA